MLAGRTRFFERRFDWDWTGHRPVETDQGATAVWMVRFPDHSLHCISDPEYAQAGAHLTPDELAKHAHRVFEMPGDEPQSISDLGEEDADLLLNEFVLVRVEVYPLETNPLPQTVPTLRSVFDDLQMNYVPYFVAMCQRASDRRQWHEILPALKRLDAARWQQYRDILDEHCDQVFVEEIAKQLPVHMGELMDLPFDGLSEAASDAVEAWRSNLVDEGIRDLYYYGQQVHERIAPLLLGIYLAMRGGEESVLERLLGLAEEALKGSPVYGCLEPSLGRVE